MEKQRMSLASAFEVAINDAINIYIREVLHRRGLLMPGASSELGEGECLQAKYLIARHLAAEWAAFDGYDRDPPSAYGEPLPIEQWMPLL